MTATLSIVITGASGFIGSAITQEALRRGHKVLALVRHVTKLTDLQAAYPTQLTVQALDVTDSQALAAAIAPHDLLISAFSGHSATDVVDYYVRGFTSTLNAVKATSRRLLVVGGAASLQLADGSMLLDSPDFPAAYRGSAEGAWQALQQLRKEHSLDWSYLSPAAEIFPGEATGHYRLGLDTFFTDDAGQSRIATGDYAKAMLDEAEQPHHRGRRFSIAY